jgi:hypothetical protein
VWAAVRHHKHNLPQHLVSWPSAGYLLDHIVSNQLKFPRNAVIGPYESEEAAYRAASMHVLVTGGLR